MPDFRVFGADFPTPGGTAIRDDVHVCDLAQAHMAALRRVPDDEDGGAYDLGAGRGCSVGEVLRMVAGVTGQDMPGAAAGQQPGEPVRLVADPAQACRDFGFRPARSDLATNVRTAWTWHSKASYAGTWVTP